MSENTEMPPVSQEWHTVCTRVFSDFLVSPAVYAAFSTTEPATVTETFCSLNFQQWFSQSSPASDYYSDSVFKLHFFTFRYFYSENLMVFIEIKKLQIQLQPCQISYKLYSNQSE